MKFTFSTLATSATLIAGAITPVAATWKGFNIGANNAQGACKTVGDYKGDFAKIKSWPGGFNAVRLYSASDCNTLAMAVPAAISSGMKILVGIWTEDWNHYSNEKAALLAAIQQHGTSWIAAVSVGSEDLYRKNTDAKTLAGQIYDVRGMVQQFNSNIKVGHTDTWTAWVDGANDEVTRACDFIITDGYPYWQSKSITSAHYYFYQSVSATKSHVQNVHNVPVWIGETGWPTGGADEGPGHPSIPNLQTYWKAVGCQMLRENQDFFWYSAFDAPTSTPEVEKHFGVAYSGRSLKINLQC